MLEIYIDFKSPAAYLALAPTKAVLAETGYAARWLPFRVRERDVPPTGKNETVGESHRRVRAESRRQLFLHYAGLQGLTMNFPKTRKGTDLALGVLAEIDGPALPYIEACFEAYWVTGADLDDAATVAKILTASGAAHNGDLSSARMALENAFEAAQAAGVVDTPGYLIGGQFFAGREHLPWVRQLIDETQ